MNSKFKIQNTKKAARYFKDELAFTSNPYSVKFALDKKERTIIVDVRSEKDYNAGHIPGAINIPCEKWISLDNPKAEIPGLIRDGFNYVYCYALLCSLSTRAAQKFASLGYPVKEIKGGFAAWKESKYAIEKSKSTGLKAVSRS